MNLTHVMQVDFLIASHLARMGEGIYDCIMKWVVNTGQSDLYMEWEYSGTSDSGLSKIGTLYNKPLYKAGHCLRFQKLHSLPRKEDNLSIKDKTTEFIIIVPNVSFIQRFHCTTFILILSWMR